MLRRNDNFLFFYILAMLCTNVAQSNVTIKIASFLLSLFFAVLSEGEHSSGSDSNVTAVIYEKLKKCGANFCATSKNSDEHPLIRPQDSEIYEISAIYLSCVLMAVLIVALFVDPLSR